MAVTSSSERISSEIYNCGEHNCVTTKHLNPDIEYGEYLDTRDNQVYRTVQIGSQVWMAQNLNYASIKSRCYRDTIERCSIVGRLYIWDDAITACPEGWHLPDSTEYNRLVDYVTKERPNNSVIEILSSKSNSKVSYIPYDFFGYSVVHGSGYWGGKSRGYDEGNLYHGYTYFWIASESIQTAYPAESYARTRVFRAGNTDVFGKATMPKENAYSVRCIKD